MCSPPQPQDNEGWNTLERNSFGLNPDEDPLLLSMDSDRVKGRVVVALGEHNVGRLTGRALAVNVEAEETRTAAPTARTTDFSMSAEILRYVRAHFGSLSNWRPGRFPMVPDAVMKCQTHVWKDTLTCSNFDLYTGSSFKKDKKKTNYITFSSHYCVQSNTRLIPV